MYRSGNILVRAENFNYLPRIVRNISRYRVAVYNHHRHTHGHGRPNIRRNHSVNSDLIGDKICYLALAVNKIFSLLPAKQRNRIHSKSRVVAFSDYRPLGNLYAMHGAGSIIFIFLIQLGQNQYLSVCIAVTDRGKLCAVRTVRGGLALYLRSVLKSGNNDIRLRFYIVKIRVSEINIVNAEYLAFNISAKLGLLVFFVKIG